MQKPTLYIALLFILSSCKLTDANITGTYQQQNQASAKLILNEDKTFEFAGRKDIGCISKVAAQPDNINFLTSGTWNLNSNKLWLNSFTGDSLKQDYHFTDSIARFTSITSFNFWNRYGDPVSIRSIHLSPAKSKPHFGNSLYLFSQDFKTTDTLIFHFDGYPDFTYPGSIPYSIGNNIHKIVLWEPYFPAAFSNTVFIPGKKKITTVEKDLVLIKKN